MRIHMRKLHRLQSGLLGELDKEVRIHMKKLLRLQSALLREIDKYEKLVPERDHFIDWERLHIANVHV